MFSVLSCVEMVGDKKSWYSCYRYLHRLPGSHHTAPPTCSSNALKADATDYHRLVAELIENGKSYPAIILLSTLLLQQKLFFWSSVWYAAQPGEQKNKKRTLIIRYYRCWRAPSPSTVSQRRITCRDSERVCSRSRQLCFFLRRAHHETNRPVAPTCLFCPTSEGMWLITIDHRH